MRWPWHCRARVCTVKPGDTLSQIAAYLGVPLNMLASQTENPARIFPGDAFIYVSEAAIDAPPGQTKK